MSDHIATVNNFNTSELNHVSFNQDNSCLLYIWNNEFGVWDTKSMKLRYDKKFSKSLGTGNILFKTNFILFGGGSADNAPLIPPHNCMLWDDNRNKFLVEIKAPKPVLNTKMVPKYTYTVTEDAVLIHGSIVFTLVQEIKTMSNPLGLISLATKDTIPQKTASSTVSSAASSDQTTATGVADGSGSGSEKEKEKVKPANTNVIATMGLTTGEIQIYHVEDGDLLSIKAHKGDISCLALNRSGTMVATASSKGTLIRVFDTKEGQLLYEFRRGTSSSDINNLGFNHIGDLLLASTANGTIHIYRLNPKQQNKYFLKSLGIKGGFDYSETNIYFKNENHRYLAGFDEDSNSIIVVSYDGVIYRYKLDATAESDIREALGDNEPKPAPSYLKWSLAETICIIPRQK
jgi:WD repeat-containing protein 45